MPRGQGPHLPVPSHARIVINSTASNSAELRGPTSQHPSQVFIETPLRTKCCLDVEPKDANNSTYSLKFFGSFRPCRVLDLL